MRGIHLTLFGFLLLPSLALASAADFVMEQPLLQSTSLSGSELSGDTEVLTPEGILSEDAFGGAEVPGLEFEPAGGAADGLPGDAAADTAAGNLNPLYQPDAPAAAAQTNGSATPAISLAAPHLADSAAARVSQPAPAASLTLPLPPVTDMPGTDDGTDDGFDIDSTGSSEGTGEE